MRKLSYGIGAAALLSFGACADAGNGSDPLDLGYKGTGIGVSIAPLTLANVTDACYSFEILNGAATPERVVARGRAVGAAAAGQGGDGGPSGLAGTPADPICGSQFGFGAEVSYVAPCDASAGNESHTVTLWVNTVCGGGTGFDASCLPIPGFVNPCGSAGCSVEATCVENADTPVEFNFTIMASAQQGFFDVAVNFDNVFCSAKLDTCYGDTFPDDSINLLFPAGESTRAQTAVAAVSCTTGPTLGADPAVNTYLHFTELSITCDTGTFTWTPDANTEEGNLVLTTAGDATLDAAVYFGTESLTDLNKVYTTFAFVLPDGSCTIDWSVVPSGDATGPTASNGADGVYTQVSGVDFNGVRVTKGECHRNQLNSSPNAQTNPDPSQVVTEYFEDDLIYTSKLAQDATAFEAP